MVFVDAGDGAEARTEVGRQCLGILDLAEFAGDRDGLAAQPFELFGEGTVDSVVVLFEEPLDASFDDGDDFFDGDGVLEEVPVDVEVELTLFHEYPHGFDGVGIDDDFFKAGAGDGYVRDVPVDQGKSFRAEAMP